MKPPLPLHSPSVVDSQSSGTDNSSESVELESFAYGSLATEFGNGYHFIAESEAIKKDEKTHAALGALCDTFAQSGDPQRVVHFGFFVREGKGWWVWLRGTPQTDWQGRQGIYLAGAALRWSETVIPSNSTLPWTIPWAALPFQTHAEIKAELEGAPTGKYREGYFLSPRVITFPVWPRSAAGALVPEKLPGLLVGARRLDDGGNYQTPIPPEAEDVVAWLALLQPPASRSGISYVVNPPSRLSWNPRLTFLSEGDMARSSEGARLWGRSPVVSGLGADLAEMISDRHARGRLCAADFLANVEPTSLDAYWRALLDEERWSNLAARIEAIDAASPEEIAGTVRYVLRTGDDAKLKAIGEHLEAVPARLVAVVAELGRVHTDSAPLLDSLEPPSCLAAWLPRLPTTPGLQEVLWLVWQRAAPSDWKAVSPEIWLKFPKPSLFRWLAAAMAKNPSVRDDAQVRLALAAATDSAIPPDVAARLIEGYLAAGDLSALFPLHCPALRRSLSEADLQRFPLERDEPAKLVRLVAGPGQTAWLYSLWRASKGPLRRLLWIESTGLIVSKLQDFSPQQRAEVLSEIPARTGDITPNELLFFKQSAARSINSIKDVIEQEDARAAWPLLATRAPVPATRTPVPATRTQVPPTSQGQRQKDTRRRWLPWAAAGGALILVGGMAGWWWSKRPITDLAEREIKRLGGPANSLQNSPY